jgi:beta-aspartyl-peptidase (threonine type)
VIIIASKNGSVGIKEAMEVLKGGGSAVDAVETGIRRVEANPEDHSVGYGGYPNLLGQVELDAGIMDGRTLATGAVGAMQDYPHAISVARKVMETLPHVFLVGRGAERFAAEMGFERQALLTEEMRQVWEERLRADISAEELSRLGEGKDLFRWVELATDPERPRGTVNFIAQDGEGNISAGVSTSGWAWKYPGRVGDSPIIGAGLYADNRAGAAACTGMGEMAIRASTAHSVVMYLRMGLPLEEAGRRGMEDLNALGGRYLGGMNLIAMDREGRYAGFSNTEERTYVYLTHEMAEPVEVPRIYVQTNRRWGEREQ